jgi:hypothetical protein
MSLLRSVVARCVADMRRAVVAAELPERGESMSETRLATLLEALDCLSDAVVGADDGVVPPAEWLDKLAYGMIMPERCVVCGNDVPATEMRAMERCLAERPPATSSAALSDAAAAVAVAVGAITGLRPGEGPQRVHAAIASACAAVSALVAAAVETVNSGEMPVLVWSGRAGGSTNPAQSERCSACGRDMPAT